MILNHSKAGSSARPAWWDPLSACGRDPLNSVWSALRPRRPGKREAWIESGKSVTFQFDISFGTDYVSSSTYRRAWPR